MDRETGWPKTFGVDLGTYFDERYYEKEVPVWGSYDPDQRFADIEPTSEFWVRVALAAALAGISLGLLVSMILRLFTRHRA